MQFSRKTLVFATALAIFNVSVMETAQAQQIQKKPYEMPTVTVKNNVEIGLYIVGGVTLLAGTGLLGAVTSFAENGSKLAHIGVWGFPAITGGLLMVGFGGMAREVDFDRVTPRILSTKTTKLGKDQQVIGTVETVWNSMRRQCRIYQKMPESVAKASIEGVASTFDTLASIKGERQRGVELCKYLEAVHTRALVEKSANHKYRADMAEDIVGHKLTQNDQILFRNLFVLAGVAPGNS